jgi:hypothetical protein
MAVIARPDRAIQHCRASMINHKGSGRLDHPLTSAMEWRSTPLSIQPLTPSNSTSKIRVALGGIAPPAPLAP